MIKKIEEIKKWMKAINSIYSNFLNSAVKELFCHHKLILCYVWFVVINILNLWYLFSSNPYQLETMCIYGVFFLLTIFILVVIAKVKEHECYYSAPNDIDALKAVIAKQTFYRASFIFIQILIWGNRLIFNYRIYRLLPDIYLRGALQWCFIFFVGCYAVYIFAILFNSWIWKTIAIFASSIYALIPLCYFFLKDNIGLFKTETFNKLLYLIAWLFHFPKSQPIIWIFLCYTIIIIAMLVALIPKFHIKKFHYAMSVMNIGVALITFYTFMNAENIVSKKSVIIAEAEKDYYNPLIQRIKEEFKSYEKKKASLSKKELEEFLSIKKSLIFFEKDMDAAREYIYHLDKSDIRDTSYMLLFPYVISCSLASLILKIRQDAVFNSEMMCDEFERERDIYYVISKDTIERIEEFEKVYKVHSDDESVEEEST